MNSTNDDDGTCFCHGLTLIEQHIFNMKEMHHTLSFGNCTVPKNWTDGIENSKMKMYSFRRHAHTLTGKLALAGHNIVIFVLHMNVRSTNDWFSICPC